MIYFVQDKAGNIKIGYANNVDKRLRSLQTGQAHQLKLLKVIPGSLSDEQALHRRFKAHRLSGEWFRPVPELLDFIGMEPVPVAPRSRGPLFPIPKDEEPLRPIVIDEGSPMRLYIAILGPILCAVVIIVIGILTGWGF